MTRPVTPNSALADLVIEEPSRAAVFERVGIDYCCAGERTLESACADAGLDLADVSARLESVEHAVEPPPTGITPLVDHLLETHHRYLHETLPRISALAAKVLDVHGERHADLGALHAAVLELQADLEPHLMKEELVLFPACREVVLATGPIQLPFGSISNPVSQLLREHDTTGALLGRLQTHVESHPLPDDACASYASLYRSLRELINDTHQHVFKENYLLFPAVVERERLLSATDRA